MDLGDARVRYPILKSCIKSEVVDTMLIMTPHDVRPTMMPPCSRPMHELNIMIASFPYFDAKDQLVRNKMQ